MHLLVGLMLERPQQHAAPRVKARAAGEVRMADDEVDDRPHFGLRCRVRTGAELFELLAPTGREIPIEVKPLLGLLHPQRESIVMLEAPFG